MIGISLLWETCADGIEIVTVTSLDRSKTLVGEDEGDLFARYRSTRRKPLRHDLTKLVDPLVVQLANARSLKRLEAFYGQHGLEMLPFTRTDERHEWPVRRPEDIRSTELVSLLVAMGSGTPTARREQANMVLRELPVRTQFETSGKAGSVGLYTNNLLNFMRWECIAVAEVGALLMECPNCQRVFLVGPMTERRGDTRYCSNACRQSAGRRRWASKGSGG